MESSVMNYSEMSKLLSDKILKLRQPLSTTISRKRYNLESSTRYHSNVTITSLFCHCSDSSKMRLKHI